MSLVVYAAFYSLCLIGLVYPWISLVGFYGFVLLAPEWNWRWDIPQEAGFQPALFICTIAGFLIRGAKIPFHAKPTKYAVLSILLFLGLCYVSNLSTINVETSSLYMRYIWKIVLVAAITSVLIDTPKKLKMLVLVGVLCHGYSVWELNVDYLQRGYCAYIEGTGWSWIGSNQLSNLTLCIMALCAGVALYSNVKILRIVAAGILLVGLHTIFILESRGVFLGLVVSSAFGIFYMPKSTWTYFALGLGAAFVAIAAGPPIVEEFMTIFADKEELDTSASSRFGLWQAGIRITMDFPLLGVGPWAGQHLVPRYYPGGLDAEVKALHNLFFEISTGCGLPAAILYFAYFFISWVTCIRELILRSGEVSDSFVKASLYAVAIGLPGFVVCNMFSAGSLIQGSYYLAAVGLCAVNIVRNPSLEDEVSPSAEETLDEEDEELEVLEVYEEQPA